jgi:hypothetical protein
MVGYTWGNAPCGWGEAVLDLPLDADCKLRS